MKPVTRRGRPKSADPLVPVITRLPTSTYDQLIRFALSRRTTVSGVLRQMVVLRLTPSRPPNIGN